MGDKLTESSRAPFHEVEARFGLNCSNGKRAFTRYNIATVQQSDSHVFPFSGVTNYHLVVGFEALKSQLRDFERLMGTLSCRDNGCVTDQWVVNT